MVDENPSHQLSSDGKKLRPVFPRGRTLIDESEVQLVDEGCRLKRVIDSLAAQLPPGHAPKLGIHDWQEFLEGRCVTSAPITEETRDVRGLRGHGRRIR